MSPRLASSRAAAIRWQGSKPSSLPFMASWRKWMMVRPLSVTSRTISARVGGWSSVLVWDSVANMCSTLRGCGGWVNGGMAGDRSWRVARDAGLGSGSGLERRGRAVQPYRAIFRGDWSATVAAPWEQGGLRTADDRHWLICAFSGPIRRCR